MRETVRKGRLTAWVLLCLFALAGCSVPENGFAWKLWGFETHSFIVGNEEISMQLDTSGFGRYEVALEEGTITIFRDEEAILEGWFTVGDYADLEQEGLDGGEYRVVEHVKEAPGSLLLYDEESGGYTLFVGVEGSLSGAAFYLSGEITEEEALDRAHRIRFTK